jgi:hypothetical protein
MKQTSFGGQWHPDQVTLDDSMSDRPEDCWCAPEMEDLPCWPCYRDGFETPNPDP